MHVPGATGKRVHLLIRIFRPVMCSRFLERKNSMAFVTINIILIFNRTMDLSAFFTTKIQQIQAHRRCRKNAQNLWGTVSC